MLLAINGMNASCDMRADRTIEESCVEASESRYKNTAAEASYFIRDHSLLRYPHLKDLQRNNRPGSDRPPLVASDAVVAPLTSVAIVSTTFSLAKMVCPV